MTILKENQIIENALLFLESQGVLAGFNKKEDDYSGIRGNLTLLKTKANLPTQVLSSISKHQMANLIEQKAKVGSHFLLLCEQISKPIQDFLRQQHINFIDCNGNIYIELEQPQVLYAIINPKNNKKKESIKDQKLTNSMAVMLFYLLAHKTELNQTVRNLASATKLSNDTIQKTKDWLKAKHYVVAQSKKEYVWNDWKAAYQRWLTAYEEDLRPKNLLKTFDWTTENQQSSRLPILQIGQYWTGEAAILHQKAGIVNIALWEIYTQGSSTELMKQLRLIPKNNGNIKAYNQFWQWESENQVLSPLLIYADLLLNTDARIQELAKKYEHEYIKRYY
jgi:hypothetical protein